MATYVNVTVGVLNVELHNSVSTIMIRQHKISVNQWTVYHKMSLKFEEFCLVNVTLNQY